MSIEPTPRQMAMRIADRIAKQHGYTLGHILTHHRHKEIMFVRWAALAEVATLFPLASLTELGNWFNRDHSSILYGLRRLGIVHQNAQTGRPKRPRKPGKPWALRKAREAELRAERERRAAILAAARRLDAEPEWEAEAA